jgi:hypothetical protein
MKITNPSPLLNQLRLEVAIRSYVNTMGREEFYQHLAKILDKIEAEVDTYEVRKAVNAR